MNKIQAKEKLLISFAEGAGTPVPKGLDANTYLRGQMDQLLLSLIQPVEVTVTGASFPEFNLRDYQSSAVWAIARCGSNWLLTLEGKQEFALGFGDTPEAIEMLGFSSSDALGEWLG